MKRVVIADLGSGNLHSVAKAVSQVAERCHVEISRQPDTITAADWFILPGQGAIGTFMGQLRDHPELGAAIKTRLKSGPVLGICVGQQALFDYSEEARDAGGLGIIPGTVKRFQFDHATTSLKQFKVPHMGWNQVQQTLDHPLWQGINDHSYFYFVHSYYAECSHPEHQVGTTTYGHHFASAIAKDMIFACQFHPEKSHHAGLKLIQNFLNWRP